MHIHLLIVIISANLNLVVIYSLCCFVHLCYLLAIFQYIYITYNKGKQKLPLNPSHHPIGWTFHPSRHPSI